MTQAGRDAALLADSAAENMAEGMGEGMAERAGGVAESSPQSVSESPAFGGALAWLAAAGDAPEHAGR